MKTSDTREAGLGLQLAAALDRTWRAIQTRHPEVPDVVLFGAPGGHRKDTDKFTVLGHFARDRWQDPAGGEKALGEVVVVAEHLARGGSDVLGTLIHEAAHSLCWARGIEDTSQNGRYHNVRYRVAAEELGLTVSSTPSGGWNETDLAEGTADAYADTITELDAAVLAAKASNVKRPDKAKRPGQTRVACLCPKARVLRVSPSVLEAGAITCGACLQDFKPTPVKVAPTGAGT